MPTSLAGKCWHNERLEAIGKLANWLTRLDLLAETNIQRGKWKSAVTSIGQKLQSVNIRQKRAQQTARSEWPTFAKC